MIHPFMRNYTAAIVCTQTNDDREIFADEAMAKYCFSLRIGRGRSPAAFFFAIPRALRLRIEDVCETFATGQQIRVDIPGFGTSR